MKNTPVNRFNVRKRCAKLGLPVPEWARKQRRGRPSTLTPEERKYKERVYNHAYYMRVTKTKRKAARFGLKGPVGTCRREDEQRLFKIIEESERIARSQHKKGNNT